MNILEVRNSVPGIVRSENSFLVKKPYIGTEPQASKLPNFRGLCVGGHVVERYQRWPELLGCQGLRHSLFFGPCFSGSHEFLHLVFPKSFT